MVITPAPHFHTGKRTVRSKRLFATALILAGLAALVTPAIGQATHRIGRTPAYLFYEGAITDSGARELERTMRRGETLSVSGQTGSPSASFEIGRIVRQNRGTIRSSSGCYDACAILALTGNQFIVPSGSTILFSKSSLRAARSNKARALEDCIPEDVSNETYVWFSPRIFESKNIVNVHFEWTLSATSRQSYVRTVSGREVVWIDSCET